MSVVFTRLVAWFTRMFDFLKTDFGIPLSVSPAIGGLFVGIIALGYPGVLYWGFTNVDEILKTGVTATAPGQVLLAQLTIVKIVATALCKGSGLVGGLYAPSLFIGASCGAVYGSIVGNAFNVALVGHDAVGHPQAYALVGMAALLASVCSVPLTSVLLLFELTKDYHILLPLMV
jgi:H+/Cl- antiporter ClcA